MQKVMISRTKTLLLKKFPRQCLMIRAMQQMPNRRLNLQTREETHCKFHNRI